MGETMSENEGSTVIRKHDSAVSGVAPYHPHHGPSALICHDQQHVIHFGFKLADYMLRYRSSFLVVVVVTVVVLKLR